ncbi:hypothetical protein [Kitasatospora cinereorecta]|uniref:Secreted protein n=1 Tax=Kitasatospora cinereorecta TaxID=285560 RepID=A0ABW0VFR4_9ACTN
MQNPKNPQRATARAAAVLAAAALTVLAAAGAAAADGQPVAGYGNAQQVLRSGQVHDTVSRFLVAARQQSAAPEVAAEGGVSGAPRSAPNAAAAPPAFELKDPVPLYELNPDFVTGKAKATPENALRLSYLTSRVAAGDGHQAAVLLAPQADGQSWQLAGIRDGDTEVGLAEGGTAAARTFGEPQIHAWYRLTQSGTVEALTKEATTGLGGRSSVTLAEYQKLVAARYGDKQPGSSYDRKGLAGGFGLADPGTDGGPAQDAAGPAPAAVAAAAPAERVGPAAVVGAVGLAAVGAAFALVRRRRARTAG